MVQSTCLAPKTRLKRFAVLAQVVEQAREARLVLSAEDRCEIGSTVGDCLEVVAQGLEIRVSAGWCGVGVKLQLSDLAIATAARSCRPCPRA